MAAVEPRRVAALVVVVLGLVPSPATAAVVFVDRFGDPPPGAGALHYPYDVAFDVTNGDIFVVDRAAFRVQKYDSKGAFLLSIGTPGTDASHQRDGELWYPSAVAVDSTGTFAYVADTANSRIQVFSTVDGGFVRKWGTEGNGNDQMSHPTGIALDGADNVYITDAGNRRVMKFTSSGTFLAKWGESGTAQGQFITPAGIAVNDQLGRVYVTDEWIGRFQEFSLDGTFVSEHGFGTPDPGEPATPYVLHNPDEIAVDPSRGLAYVIEAGGNGGGAGQEVSMFDVTMEGRDSFVDDFYGTPAAGSSYGFSPHGIGLNPETGELLVAAGSADGKKMFRYQTSAIPKLHVDARKRPSPGRTKELAFDIRHDMVLGSCSVDATGELRTPATDPVFQGEDFALHGPGGVVPSKKTTKYTIPLSNAAARAVRETKALVDITFTSPRGCNGATDRPKPVRLRYSI